MTCEEAVAVQPHALAGGIRCEAKRCERLQHQCELSHPPFGEPLTDRRSLEIDVCQRRVRGSFPSLITVHRGGLCCGQKPSSLPNSLVHTPLSLVSR